MVEPILLKKWAMFGIYMLNFCPCRLLLPKQQLWRMSRAWGEDIKNRCSMYERLNPRCPMYEISISCHIYIYTQNPTDPCFDWKRPCFRGLTFKNRGQLGSRYIISQFVGKQSVNEVLVAESRVEDQVVPSSQCSMMFGAT